MAWRPQGCSDERSWSPSWTSFSPRSGLTVCPVLAQVDSRASLSRNRPAFQQIQTATAPRLLLSSSSPSLTGPACPCTLPSGSLSPSAPSPSPETVSPPCSTGHSYIYKYKPNRSELKVVGLQLYLELSLPFLSLHFNCFIYVYI